MADAVVIGGGHNGLVAANLLADEGWDVVVVEANAEPGGAALRPAARLRTPRHLLESARFAVLPVRRMMEERFRGDGAAVLMAGNTLHADLGPDVTIGGVFAWLLTMLGQEVGFPVPEG